MKPVIGTQASLCIAFGTKYLYRRIPATFRLNTLAGTGQQEIYDALQDALPPRCGCVLAYSEGILGSNNEKDNIIEVAHLPARAAFAAITIPKIPRVTTHVFRIDQDESVATGLPQFKFEIFKGGEYHTVTKVNKELLHGTVKCVLLFSDEMVTYMDMSTPQKLFSLIKEGQSENFAFGGCVVTSTLVPKIELVAMAGGVLFCGDNLLAASVVIREADTDDRSIEERMLELKSCNFPLKNSMALMFSCVGRPDLVSETRCFQRHFPNTPLIGLVGNGETGWTYLPKSGDQQASGIMPKRRAPNLEHYYSTVVVLLSWDDS
ncbi:hypothetical protein B566_EDAN005389 [Ephemera danica]|nr:hypothetical protein B566_EDAN005388 [Ephemera danica]KAF4524331.1 hypothetical protein B566_EDAN005389 [Ephemera danica]